MGGGYTDKVFKSSKLGFYNDLGQRGHKTFLISSKTCICKMKWIRKSSQIRKKLNHHNNNYKNHFQAQAQQYAKNGAITCIIYHTVILKTHTPKVKRQTAWVGFGSGCVTLCSKSTSLGFSNHIIFFFNYEMCEVVFKWNKLIFYSVWNSSRHIIDNI